MPTQLISAPINTDDPVVPRHAPVPLQARTGPGGPFQELFISETGGLLVAQRAVQWRKYLVPASQTLEVSSEPAVVYGAMLGTDPGSQIITLFEAATSELPLSLLPLSLPTPALFSAGFSISSHTLLTDLKVFIQWAPATET